jgi:hypothetical protein
MRATWCLAVLTVPVLALAADSPEGGRVSVAVARGRSGLMHEVFADNLEVVHRHYFRRDGPSCRRGRWRTRSPGWTGGRG